MSLRSDCTPWGGVDGQRRRRGGVQHRKIQVEEVMDKRQVLEFSATVVCPVRNR